MSESMSMEEFAELGENTLVHFGVKGMRWGVRRSGGSTASKATETKQPSSLTKIGKTAAKTVLAGTAGTIVVGAITVAAAAAGLEALSEGVSDAALESQRISRGGS